MSQVPVCYKLCLLICELDAIPNLTQYQIPLKTFRLGGCTLELLRHEQNDMLRLLLDLFLPVQIWPVCCLLAR